MNRKKILLLGKSGMLGSCFLRQLTEEGCELAAFDREELDVTDYEAMQLVFQQVRPDLVINCTGYTAVDDAEKNRDLAFKINAGVPGEIAKNCRLVGAGLIHFSTDYVFDGGKVEGYLEDDLTGAVNVYGESKLAGEKLVLESGADFYIVRTSWLFGPNGKNFVDTMLKLGKKAVKNGTELRVVDDQIGSPTYVEDLCLAVIENFVRKSPDSGIYHLTNSGACSWYELAKKIFEINGMKVRVLPVDSEKFPRPARRPKCSILKNSKIKLLRNWEAALEEYLVSI